jgi:rRNA-processing protein FCF1
VISYLWVPYVGLSLAAGCRTHWRKLLTVENDKKQITAARVVVVDTNGFGGGRLGKNDLENIRSLTTAGVKVVVPDVVCHELSSHTISEFSRVPFAFLESLGIDIGDARSVQASSAPESIYKKVVQMIEAAGAEVRESLNEWWREGLRRQVYQEPPAESKSSIKTGAIDTIIFQHLASVINEYGEGLIVTNDGPLTKYCESRSYTVVKSFQEAKSRVLSNANVVHVTGLLRRMYFDEGWLAAFRGLVGKFDSRSTFEGITVLGLANLVSRNRELQGTILFKASERMPSGGLDAPAAASHN